MGSSQVKETNGKKRKIGIWLISSHGSSHSVLCVCSFTGDPIKKHDDLVGVVLLEPLAV